MELEIWKRIHYKNLPTRYIVSNTARVINTDTGKELIPQKDSKSAGVGKYYLKVSLAVRKGICKRFKLHRLVAVYFVYNPDPLSKIYVNHKDGNTQNNHADNLEWVTAKENVQHAFRIGLVSVGKGENNPFNKISENVVRRICELLEENILTFKEIAKLTGTSKSLVNSIRRKDSWAEISAQYNINPPIPIANDYRKFYHKIDSLIIAGLKPSQIIEEVPINTSRKKYISLINHRRDYLRKNNMI